MSDDGGSVPQVARSTSFRDSSTNCKSERRVSGSSERTMNFFHRVLQGRDHLYATDTPREISARSQTTNVSELSNRWYRTTSSRGMSGDVGPNVEDSRSADDSGPSLWKKLTCQTTSRKAIIERMRGVICSKLWKALLSCSTFILFFGPELRTLVFKKSADTAIDVVFVIVFCIFVVDMIMRIIAEPYYFRFNTWFSQSEYYDYSGGRSCTIGSFVFWCELVSMLTLPFEVSFINKQHFSENRMEITLSSLGVPSFDTDPFNTAIPVEIDDASLVGVVLRTARIARFLRSDAAELLANRFRWQWILDLFNPCVWWTSLSERRRLNKENESMDEKTPGRSRSVESRRSSWGGLGISVLAAVKARETSSTKTPWRQVPVQVLQSVGIMRKGNEQFRREVAARKIQRAWRALLRDENNDESEVTSTNDVAWSGTGVGGSRSSPIERALLLKKKTLLSQHQNQRFRGKVSSESNRLLSSRMSHTNSLTLATLETQRREVKVGTTMRERTGQRVALGIILTLLATMLFTYTEYDSTRPSTMIVLHTDTSFPQFANQALDSARARAIPELFEYQFRDGTVRNFALEDEDIDALRPREIIHISVSGSAVEGTTEGYFAFKQEQREIAIISMLATVFVLCMWFFGVTAFAGPVMMLVVIPIERMVRLLAMLMRDPLGYQGHLRYKKLIEEEKEMTKNTRWTKEILKGMETSFLMSTILRIGNLLKVGFGSAGAEIIRKNLEKGQAKNMLDLHSQGTTVSCIFLFCDIRQFTDATECLQEEVFVFTNRIAAVVHSICHAYGGSANKNVGDAFLLSWILDEDNVRGSTTSVVNGAIRRSRTGPNYSASKNEADKALLSVVKICISLYYDDYYIESMTDQARRTLLEKLSNREGPVVQMGFGLHAGQAVQGAIGSQRKIDATYVSEAVERAEYLESSTKKYGVPVLMSDSFHTLLQSKTRGRCRKIDQVKMQNSDENEEEEEEDLVDIIELFTFDMDIPALFRSFAKTENEAEADTIPHDRSSFRATGLAVMGGSKRQISSRGGQPSRRRKFLGLIDASEELTELKDPPAQPSSTVPTKAKLQLPTGQLMYNANVWMSPEMRIVRERFTDGIFFQAFNSGLQAFYAKDWETSRANFAAILDRFEDGPSRYFYNQIWDKDTDTLRVPPRKFRGYGIA